jgi:hypothetical protein
MIRLTLMLAIAVCCLAVPLRAQNFLKNGSFEERDPADRSTARYWTAGKSAPLRFAGEHYQGAEAALLAGDDATHQWKQTIEVPATIGKFTLSGFARAENAVGHAALRANLARPVTIDIPPGTYDWKRFAVDLETNGVATIEITLGGQLSSGRIAFDQIELTEQTPTTPAGMLARKIEDLSGNLARIGPIDPTVADAQHYLIEAKKRTSSDLDNATSEWIAAARTLDHAAWAAMFPDAMSDRPIEAQMLYHGIGPNAASCDAAMKILTASGCNAVFHSLGAWTVVIHHSRLLDVVPEYQPFDALQYQIASAKRHGIKSFAYLATLCGVRSPSATIYREHPEWFAHSSEPDAPIYLDPANPDAADFITRCYVELAENYDLDGIGLDYLRYPSETACREATARHKESGDAVAQLAHRIRQAVHRVKPNMVIIACLLADPDNARNFGQDWNALAPSIDFATPMNYDDVSADATLLARQRDLFARRGVRFIPAIGGMPELHQAWTISTWAKRIALARKTGCDGLIIYRSGGLDPAVAAFLGNGPFFSKATFPEPLPPTQAETRREPQP